MPVRHSAVDTSILDQLWPADTRDDELEFMHHTGAVSHALHRARLSGDRPNAERMFDCLAAARDCWRREPQAAMLDHAYAEACCTPAEWGDRRERVRDA